MKTVRVHCMNKPETAVVGRGASLPSAVQRAAFRIFGRPGRSVGHERIDSHTFEWAWRTGGITHVLIVRESRSGPGGEASTRQVPLRLSDEDAVRLDDLARRQGLNRSAFVAMLVKDWCARRS